MPKTRRNGADATPGYPHGLSRLRLGLCTFETRELRVTTCSECGGKNSGSEKSERTCTLRALDGEGVASR